MALEQLKLSMIREMTDVEIRAKVAEYQKEGFGMRFKQATEVLANPNELRIARRTVARLQTVLAERAAKAKSA
jgi:large subunit ribosomal protein L29